MFNKNNSVIINWKKKKTNNNSVSITISDYESDELGWVQVLHLTLPIASVPSQNGRRANLQT